MIETPRPKPFVFVLMPFAREFDDIYKFGIKAACQEAGAYCERVDEQFFTESILERVYNQIAKADLIVSDLTGRNPNVFYETGFAHALGKQVIHLTKIADDIPFDLKHFPHIIHQGSISFLKEELKKRVSWHIENPNRVLSTVDLMLEILVNGIVLKDKPTIKIEVQNQTSIDLTIQFHNPSNKVYNLEDWQFGLIAPNSLRHSITESRVWPRFGEPIRGTPTPITNLMKVVLEDKTIYFFPKFQVERLLPDSWLQQQISIGFEKLLTPDLTMRINSLPLESLTDDQKREKIYRNIELEFCMRVFNLLGPVDQIFRLNAAFIFQKYVPKPSN